MAACTASIRATRTWRSNAGSMRPWGGKSIRNTPLLRQRKRRRYWWSAAARPGWRWRVVAAKRGHEVVLYEKASYLGGLIPMAAIVKDTETEDLMKYIRYQEKQLKNEGVTVHMKSEVNADTIRKEKPDAVVVATGAAYSKFSVPGGDNGKVISAAKLHKRLNWLLKYFTPQQLQKLTHYYMPVGKSAAVVGGTLHGAELTEFLTKRKRKVVMVHDGPKSELGKGMTNDDVDKSLALAAQEERPDLH